MKRTTGYNSTLAIGGVSTPLDSFVVTESLVLRMNLSTITPHYCRTPNPCVLGLATSIKIKI